MLERLNFLPVMLVVAAGALLAGCGDFAEAKVCTANADPSCDQPPRQNSGPFLNGPNPNFPDPNNAPPALDAGDRAEAPAASATLVISEVLLNPVGDNAGFQKIELANLDSVNSHDLSGYRLAFSDGESEYTFGSGTTLAAGGFLVIHVGEFGQDSATDAFIGEMPTLNAEHGSLTLISPDGAIVSFVQYGKTGQRFEREAINDRVWVKDSASALPVEGTSLNFYAGYASGSASYWAQYPSLGEANPAPLNRR